MSEHAEQVVSVQLLALPVDLHRRASDHQNTLRRELALVEAGEPAAAGARLIELSQTFRERYGAFTERQEATLAGAADEHVLNLTYDVPADAADAAEQLDLLLDEIDEVCRTGQLVTLVTPSNAVAYRKWFLGEFIHQIRDGRPPRPWPGVAVDAPPEEPSAPVGDVEPIAVDGDLDLFGAPALRTTIVERLEAGETWVVVDLSRCAFIDSVGLSLLLTTRERCRAAGGGLTVVGADDAALRLFDTVGVRELLTR